MIKDNQKSLNHVQVLLDAVVTAVAYILAWFIIVSGKVVPLRGATLEPGPYFLALIFIVPVYLILNGCFHLYVPKRIQGRRVEFANICKANVIGLMLNKSIRELDIRRLYGINIIAIERDHRTDVEFSPDSRFQDGDTILVIGKSEKIDRFERSFQD